MDKKISLSLFFIFAVIFILLVVPEIFYMHLAIMAISSLIAIAPLFFYIKSKKTPTSTLPHPVEILTRNFFIHELDHHIDYANYTTSQFYLLFLDVNNFKQVNYTLGQDAGDLLLEEMGQRIKLAVEPGSIVAKVGGDDFAIIMDHTVNSPDYITIASELSREICKPFRIKGKTVYVGVSIGVALFPQNGKTAQDLLRCAEIAMYTAKTEKKEVSLYYLNHDKYKLTNLTLLGELRDAITNKELELWFQPKQDLKTKKITAIEALIRWRHPIRGLMNPELFLPYIESSGIIHYITRFVIEEATNTYKILKTNGFDLDVSINISPNDLVDDSIVSFIIKNIVQTGMSPEKLILEITETAFMHDTGTSFKIIEALHSLGIKISIDDFGTGHASFIYLKHLPISEIKLDRVFIMDVISRNEDYNIIKTTIKLAQDLHITTIAEGVETKNVYDCIIELGCDLGQGYYIAKPMPLLELLTWLKEQPS